MPAIIYLTIMYDPAQRDYALATSLYNPVAYLIISIILFFCLVFIRAYGKSDLPGNVRQALVEKKQELMPEDELNSFTLKDVLYIALAILLVVLFFVCVLD